MTTRQTMKTQVRLFPAPAPLATVTDLTPREVQAITEPVNPLIADAFALYVKTKNFHWHLSGSHFRDYHLLFDEQAEAIFESIDIMAERVRRVGAATIRSISHIGQLQTIDDDNDDFVPAGQLIKRLMYDKAHNPQVIHSALERLVHHPDSPPTTAFQR